jgi:2-oxoisovalerate dehydrogenase E1 component alpha subunit
MPAPHTTNHPPFYPASTHQVLKALEAAETAGKPSLEEMFTDVFDEKPAHLVEQEEAMLAHIAKYPDKY